MNEYNDIRDQLILAAVRAYTRGIQTGSGGNFSARVPDRELMLVKASGGAFIDATRESLLLTDFDGNVVAGTGKPTREALLHGYIYKVAPKVNSVIHCHSPWAIGWAQTGLPLDGITLHTQLKFNCPIDVLDVTTPMVEEKDLPLVKALFDANPNLPAFILANHGVVAMGDNAINAEHNAELVEETAQVAVLKRILDRLK